VVGDRPLPSYLGGGDLDGDEYNLIPLDTVPAFMPKKTYSPAPYTPATRKVLDRPSTMDDVADFFVEYINSDVIISCTSCFSYSFDNVGPRNHCPKLVDHC
jgi:RNA-dependent RNA polymerase